MADSPLLTSNGVTSLTILSAGTALADTIQIVSVETDLGINRIPCARITVIDGDMPNAAFPISDSDTFKPGTVITIQAGYDNIVATIFEGIVIKQSVKFSGDNEARLVIDCRDKALAMTVARKNANYVNKLDSDIINTLVQNAGLSATVATTTTTNQELVQYYCTDWDFMLARAEVNAMIVTVDAGKITVQAPDTSATPLLTLTYGTDLQAFQAELDAASQLQSVQSIGWNLTNQSVLQKRAEANALTGQGNLQANDLSSVLKVPIFNLQSAASQEETALTAWADAQQLKAALARIRGNMRFQGNALPKPGCLLELKGVGARFNGNVLVSRVQHRVQDGNWITDVDFGMPATWFTEQHDIAAPPAAGITAGVTGLQIGVVMKLDADPEGQYKVQVSIPVMQAKTDGVWARLSNFYASSGFGSFFIPEIGDEVILGYFNDDPSHPVILGSLYSSSRKPAYELTADNFTKAIVTKSLMKMTFDDDKKIITLLTPGGNTIVISDDGKSILLQDQNNNTVKLSENGIALNSPKDITLSAQGKVSISAVNNIELTAKADVKAEGLNINHNAQIGFVGKGAATAEVSASGTTTIKGAMVMIN